MKNSGKCLQKPYVLIEETKELAVKAMISDSKGGYGTPAT